MFSGGAGHSRCVLWRGWSQPLPPRNTIPRGPLPTPAAHAAAPSLRDGAPVASSFSPCDKTCGRLHLGPPAVLHHETQHMQPGGGVWVTVWFGGFEANPPPTKYDSAGPPSRRRPLSRPPHRGAAGPQQFDPTQPGHVQPGGGEGLGARPSENTAWRGSLGESAGSYPGERVWVPDPQKTQPGGRVWVNRRGRTPARGSGCQTLI